MTGANYRGVGKKNKKKGVGLMIGGREKNKKRGVGGKKKVTRAFFFLGGLGGCIVVELYG